MGSFIDIQKNSKQIIRIQKRRFKGTEFVDLRIFNKGFGKYEGKEFPTKTGITFSLDLIPQIIQAIQKAKELEVSEGTGDTSSGGPGADVSF